MPVTIQDKRGAAVNFARGRIGDLASALGYDRLGELTDKQREEIFNFVLVQWVTAVRRTLKPNQVPKYEQGIVRRNTASDPKKIEWSLQGFDAVSLEFGWAPPAGRGMHRSDGIGEWDGAVHDMRSYMLTEGNPGLKTSKPDEQGRGGGKKYMLVPFHENERSSDLSKKIGATDEFRQALSNLGVGGILDVAATADMDVAARKQVRKILSRRFMGPLQRRGGHVVAPSEDASREQRLTRHRKFSNYRKIIRNYSDLPSAKALEADRQREPGVPAKRTKGSGRAVGFRFTMIRTITEDLENKSRSWMTTGYPPAELLQEVRKEAARAITNVLAGRAPGDDGGTA